MTFGLLRIPLKNRKTLNERKYFPYHISDNEFKSITYKELLQLHKKNKQTLKKWENDSSRDLLKKELKKFQ